MMQVERLGGAILAKDLSVSVTNVHDLGVSTVSVHGIPSWLQGRDYVKSE